MAEVKGLTIHLTGSDRIALGIALDMAYEDIHDYVTDELPDPAVLRPIGTLALKAELHAPGRWNDLADEIESVTVREHWDAPGDLQTLLGNALIEAEIRIAAAMLENKSPE